MRAERRQHRLDAVGGVCVVDEDLGAVAAAGDELEPSGDADEVSHGLGRGDEGRAGGDDEAERDQRIAGLEGAEEGKPDLHRLALEDDPKLLAGSVGKPEQQAKIGAGGAAGLERA